MKSAQSSAEKFVRNAGAAAGDYAAGAQNTTKDQAQAAIAAKASYAAGVTASIARGGYEKGLAKSGKQGWLAGVTGKGAERFPGGVASSATKYATNSGVYDGARGAAASLPRGPKGSAGNLQRVSAVANALRQRKTGATA